MKPARERENSRFNLGSRHGLTKQGTGQFGSEIAAARVQMQRVSLAKPRHERGLAKDRGQRG